MRERRLKKKPKWHEKPLVRVAASMSVLCLVLTGFLLLSSSEVKASDDYTFDGETVNDGYSIGPTNKNAEDGSYNQLIEEDMYADTNFTASTENVDLGSAGGGAFPTALSTDDGTRRSYTEENTGGAGDAYNVYLFPTGDSSVNWDTVYPSGSHYAQVDEPTYDSDTTYVATGTNSDVDLFTMGDMGEPDSGYDIDVTAFAVHKKDSNPGATFQAGVRISSTDYLTIDLNPTNGVWVNTSGTTWTVNPNTLAEWTWSEVNALEGIITTDDASPTVYCTQFGLLVSVTIPGSTNYELDVNIVYSSVTSTSQTTSYHVYCQGYRTDASEDFGVFAWDYVGLDWNLKDTIDAGSDADFDFALTADERDGTGNEVKIRILGGTESSDTTQNVVYIDVLKIKRIEQGYALDVELTSTTVAEYGNITLRIKGYTSAEQFNCNVWNYSASAYDNDKLAITDLGNAWQTTLDLCDDHHRSGQTVKIQFTDETAYTADTTRDTLYLDVAWVTRYHTDPTITIFGAAPLLINEGETAYFWCNYTDYDNEEPTLMDVHIDTSDFGMSKNVSDTSYHNGVNYSYSTSALTNGNWTFYYRTQDANSGVVTSSSDIIAVNALPTLTGKGVDPPTGGPDTYSFYVTYTDEDDNAPAWVRVTIDGAWFEMVGNVTNDGDFTDGESYYYEKAMDTGSHPYVFWTQDYNSGNITTVSANLNVGTPPTITDYYVCPNNVTEGTEIVFFATYTDADNNAPLFFDLDIGGLNWNMLENDTEDVTYTDGKAFYLTNTNLTNGNYTCFYKTQDENSDPVNSDSFTCTINALPVLSADTVYPSTGNAGAQFNFTVTFTDDDGNYPNYIQAVIDSTPYSMLEVSPADTNTVDGKDYYYLKVMSGGTHPYYFKTADYLLVNVQTTGKNLVVNNIPALSDFGRLPSDPVYVTTLLNFTVTFTDADDDMPTSIKWREDGGTTQNVTMLQVDSGDSTTTDGKDYYITMYLGHGVHSYDFYGSDSGSWTSGGSNSVTIVNRDPVISNGPGVSVNEWRNTAWEYDFDGSDPDTDTIIWGRAGYTWLTINSGTGMLSGTTPDATGDYEFTVYANDSYGGQDTYVFTIHVLNRAPDITNGPGADVYEIRNNEWYYDFDATDADTDSVGWEVSGEAWLTIDGVGNLSGTTTDTPGVYTFIVYANDSYGGSDSYEFDMHVENQDPVISNGPGVSVNEWRNTAWEYDFDGSDPDTDSITWGRSGYTWLTINSGTGLLSGTTPDTVGDYQFTVYANDSYGGQDTYVFTLHTINRAPVITSAGNTTQQIDTYMAYEVTFTDADTDSCTVELSTNATWLSISGVWINGTATPLGWYACTIWVNDSYGGSDTDYWEVTVTSPANQPPSYTSAPIEEEGHPVNYYYDCNATDPESDPLTYDVSSTHPNIEIDSDTGEVTGYIATPGEWWINISVTDGEFTVWQNYTLTTTNTAPTFTSTPTEEWQHGTVYTYDANANDADGDSYTFDLEGNCTAFLNIVPGTGVITGTPPTVGWWYVNVSVSDTYSITWQNYTLTGLNTAPTFTSSGITEWQNGTSYYYDANSNDINSDTVAWDLEGNGTSFLSIDPVTGEVSGLVPSLGWWYVNISLSDSWSTTWQNFSLYGLNTAPTITTTPGTTGYTGVEYYYDADATDLNGDDLYWDYTEKPVWLVIDPDTGNCTGIPVIDGNYDVELRVTDSEGGMDWQNWTIIVTTYVPPEPEVVEDLPDYGAPFYARFTYWVRGLTVVVQDASIGEIERWQWNFGDGFGSQGTKITHKYDRSGTYIITLTIIGEDGQRHSVQVEVTVQDDPSWYIEKGEVGWIIGTPVGAFNWSGAISLLAGAFILLISFGQKRLPVVGRFIRPKTFKVIGLVLLVVGVLFYLA